MMRRLIFRTGCLCLLVLISTRPPGASGQGTASERPNPSTLDVRGVPLTDALMHLARARHLELAYAPELVAGKVSTCATASGDRDDNDALRCVLAGSRLVAQRLPHGVYVIRGPEPSTDAVSAAGTGTIVGVVVGDRDSLVGAHVRVVGTQLAAASGLDGRFVIPRVPPGLYDLEVSMVGFQSRQFRRIEVEEEGEVGVELALDEATLPLDEVVVTSEQASRAASVGAGALDVIDGFQGVRVGPVSGGLLISARPEPVRGVQFGGVGSVVRDSLSGVQFGGVFNAASGVARGVQFGGVFNTVGGDMRGVQYGGVGNTLEGDFAGVQFGGVANRVKRSTSGVQFGGVLNTSGGLRGAQFGGVLNTAGRSVRGAQVAGVINVAGDLTGGQSAGVVNVASSMRGLQLGGVANVARGEATGAQVAGVVNVAGSVKGLQLGLVNVSRHNVGLPIGLVSYVADVGLRFDVWVDETGMVTSVVRSGTRRFSNYLGVGARPGALERPTAVVFGLGGEFDLRPRLAAAVDAFSYGAGWNDWDDELIKLRALVRYHLTPHVGVFAGPTLNLLLSSEPENTAVVPWKGRHGRWADTYYDLWPGLSVGLRVSTRPS